LLRTCSVTVLAGRSAIPSPGAADRRFSSSLPGEHVDGLDHLLRLCRAHKEPVVTRVERVCPAGGVLPHGCIPGAKVSSPVRDRNRRFEPCRDGTRLSSRVLVVRAVSFASTTSERRSRSSARTAVISQVRKIERAGQDCAIETARFEPISQPYTREGHRTGALRFEDPRVMALGGALCAMVPWSTPSPPLPT